LPELQLRPHPFRDRDPPDPEPAVPGLRADVREAQEIERLRLTQAPGCPFRGGEPPELDQPGLARVLFQPELREPLPEPGQEPSGVLAILNPTMKSSAYAQPRIMPLEEFRCWSAGTRGSIIWGWLRAF
jgi:hypothetical protein